MQLRALSTCSIRSTSHEVSSSTEVLKGGGLLGKLEDATSVRRVVLNYQERTDTAPSYSDEIEKQINDPSALYESYARSVMQLR